MPPHRAHRLAVLLQVSSMLPIRRSPPATLRWQRCRASWKRTSTTTRSADASTNNTSNIDTVTLAEQGDVMTSQGERRFLSLFFHPSNRIDATVLLCHVEQN